MIASQQQQSECKQLAIQQKQIDNLYQAIIREYQSLFDKLQPSDNSTITQLFLLIIQYKNDLITNNQKEHLIAIQHLQSQLNVYQNQCTINSNISSKQSKIVSQLIKQKNVIIQQKQHLQLKYDKLLQMVREQRNKQNKFKSNNKEFQKRISQLQQQQTKKDIQREQLIKQIHIIQNKTKQFQKQKNTFQSLFQNMKNIVKQQLNDMEINFQQCLQKIQQQHVSQILQYKSMLEQIKNSQVPNYFQRKRIQEICRDKHQLMMQLEQLSKFKRKYDEDDDDWWMKYKQQKEKQKQLLHNKITNNCNNYKVYSEYYKFRQDTRNYLKKMKQYTR